MRSPAQLQVELKASTLAQMLVAIAFLATAALVAWLPLAAWLRAAAVIVIGFHSLLALRRATRSESDSWIMMKVAADRRTTMTTRDGRSIEGMVLAETYVGESLTSIVWRPDGARRSRAVALLPDMMPREDLRRLRVILRYSQASDDDSVPQDHAA